MLPTCQSLSKADWLMVNHCYRSFDKVRVKNHVQLFSTNPTCPSLLVIISRTGNSLLVQVCADLPWKLQYRAVYISQHFSTLSGYSGSGRVSKLRRSCRRLAYILYCFRKCGYLVVDLCLGNMEVRFNNYNLLDHHCWNQQRQIKISGTGEPKKLY